MGCRQGSKGPPAIPADEREVALLASEKQSGPVVVTHGGVGTSPALSDGPSTAAKRALARLEADEDVLDAAVEGTVALEDDPRFNAGTGANIRLDGRTIQMDASLMTHEGRFAAVAVIERVKNPILVARRVLDSPHILLAGEGATRFAHRLGFEDVVPESEAAREAYRRRLALVREKLRLGEGADWPALWNFPNPLPPELREGSDTVGTVARDRAGRFAATLSTGGTSVTLFGRVGDVPIFGAGLFAGPAGAVACTGHGEEIVKRSVARSVYEALAEGQDARDALHRALLDFPRSASLGIIAVDRKGWAVAARQAMAYGVATSP